MKFGSRKVESLFQMQESCLAYDPVIRRDTAMVPVRGEASRVK